MERRKYVDAWWELSYFYALDRRLLWILESAWNKRNPSKCSGQ